MTSAQGSSPQAVVERFLEALSRRDVDAMVAENAPDIVCVFPTAPGGPQELVGWDTNRAFYSTYIRPMTSTFALTRKAVHPRADDLERVVAESASDGTMVDGNPYQNRYLCLATVRDGKIQHWTEFADPAPIERAPASVQTTMQTTMQTTRGTGEGRRFGNGQAVRCRAVDLGMSRLSLR